MLRGYSILSVVLVLALVGPSSAAESPFNVDFFCGWGSCYRPMEWTPVEIGISSTLTKPFAGSVTISAQQDGLNTLNVAHQFVLTPDIPLNLPLVTKLAFGADKCSVRIANERGRTRWHHNFDLWDFSRRNRLLTAVRENDLLIGLVGSRKFGLLSLPKQSICRSNTGEGKVYLGDKLPRMVPWDWTGFASLDLLILYNPDWALFNRHQLNAIAQWVSNGGRLLLVLGSHPLPAENAIAKLLPFEVRQVKQVTVASEVLETWQLNYTKSETVACWPLVPKPEAHLCEAETVSGDECLFATGYVGFGRVGILAFDPSTFSDRQKANSVRFWAGRVAAVLEDAPLKPMRPKEQTATRRKRRPKRTIKWALTGDLTHPDKNEGGIELTIGGLEVGKYRMTSWHNNPHTRHSPIDVYVDGTLRTRNIRQSAAMDDEDAARAITEFTISGSNNAVIEFRPVSSELNERVMLCGFEIIRLHAGDNPTTGDVGRRVFAVDIGATGQPVADGFISLGYGVGDRRNYARFSDTDGLPAGVTVTLKPTNPQDDLQFNPNPGVPARQRSRSRPSRPGVVSYRSIEFAEDAEHRSDDRGGDRWYQPGRAQTGSNAIMEYLYSIAELRPLSIWWVILLLTTLALLLGPLDYKVLKRLGRLPLTWLTCAVWIVLFTAGAYYGVQALRGGEMQLRAVSVLDGIEDKDNKCVWSSAYLGLFAPYSADYRLKGLQDNQWWSGIAPTRQEHIYAYRREAGRRNIYCFQHDGGNLPYSVPINIWTMQCLLNESPQQHLPFTAEVELSGDELILNIVNQSDSAIRRGYVLFGKDKALDFGRVLAHSNSQFRGQLRHRVVWTTDNIEHYPTKFDCEKAFFAQGSLQRTQAMKAYLANGAAVVCAEYDDAPVPFAVKDRPCDYNHIQLVRQVVFPKQEKKEAENDPNQTSH